MCAGIRLQFFYKELTCMTFFYGSLRLVTTDYN
uniref:Uncharacterized protein n=1 Tax=Arundo donax TaxID=35708 RepID=A0A0A9G252_ARUDO